LTKAQLLDLLKDRVFLCDGAMGTMLYAKGVYLNTCFDELNLRGPDLVKEIHREYIRSGADIIESNTFGANRFKLKKHGLEDRVHEINLAGARLARQEAGRAVLVAGSIGPLGVNIEPWGQTSVEEAEQAFAEQARGLVEGGIDLFILETFSDIHEIRQAIKAVQTAGRDVPLIAQMTIDEEGASLYGTTPDVFTKKLEEWGADVIGVNCSVGPAAMLQCIEKMARLTERPLSAMPNAGIPRAVDGRNIYLCSPDYMAEYAKRFILNGVKIIGGCCGTTPAHIKAMRGAIKALRPPQRVVLSVGGPVEERVQEKGIPAGQKSGLGQKLDEKKFVVSVEIVPPRGFEAGQALASARLLKRRGVDCINIPDGPRASARMSSMALAVILNSQAKIEPILHYTCRDRNLLGMQSDLLGLYAQKIRNLLIITGDPPKMGDYPDATAVFDVDSVGLTRLVNALNRGADIGGKKLGPPTGFLIGVGANPGAIDLDYEISRFESKVEAGAEFVITQPVFDIRRLENFLRRVEGCRIPVLAGIWPLSSLRNAEFMHNEVPGATIPPEIMARMQKAQDIGPEQAKGEGVAIAREILAAIKGAVEGVQISPPLGRIELALDVLEILEL
jgi:methionine synthase I (cobalamin-dependent)/5,10-methylenetetrahydrofolate reductase